MLRCCLGNIREDSNQLCQMEILRELDRLGQLNKLFEDLTAQELDYIARMHAQRTLVPEDDGIIDEQINSAVPDDVPEKDNDVEMEDHQKNK